MTQSHSAFAADFGEMLTERLKLLAFQQPSPVDEGKRYETSEHIPFLACAQSPEELEELLAAVGSFAFEAATKMETAAATLCPNLQVIEEDVAEHVRRYAVDYAREILTPTERYKEAVREKMPEGPPEGKLVTLNLAFAVFHNVFAYGISTTIWTSDPNDPEELWDLGTVQSFSSPVPVYPWP